MHILVVSIFDDVLGLSLLPSQHYYPWRSRYKEKSIFDAEVEEDAHWVLGVETEDTLIALSPVCFSCVVMLIYY